MTQKNTKPATALFIAGTKQVIKAGILAFGSTYFPRLPIRETDSDMIANFVPDYSAGTAPVSHGIPH